MREAHQRGGDLANLKASEARRTERDAGVRILVADGRVREEHDVARLPRHQASSVLRGDATLVAIGELDVANLQRTDGIQSASCGAAVRSAAPDPRRD